MNIQNININLEKIIPELNAERNNLAIIKKYYRRLKKKEEKGVFLFELKRVVLNSDIELSIPIDLDPSIETWINQRLIIDRLKIEFQSGINLANFRDVSLTRIADYLSNLYPRESEEEMVRYYLNILLLSVTEKTTISSLIFFLTEGHVAVDKFLDSNLSYNDKLKYAESQTSELKKTIDGLILNYDEVATKDLRKFHFDLMLFGFWSMVHIFYFRGELFHTWVQVKKYLYEILETNEKRIDFLQWYIKEWSIKSAFNLRYVVPKDVIDSLIRAAKIQLEWIEGRTLDAHNPVVNQPVTIISKIDWVREERLLLYLFENLMKNNFLNPSFKKTKFKFLSDHFLVNGHELNPKQLANQVSQMNNNKKSLGKPEGAEEIDAIVAQI